MKFCSVCGSRVGVGIPAGDNRERHICEHCGTIHYQNPKIVTGCIISKGDRILLCKRAIEPRYGLWTVPAGFMENGETTYQGAMRETWEEAKARVQVEDLYITVNLPHINQVYMLFRAQLIGDDYGPGEESLQVDLFEPAQIPWDKMAFPTVSLALEQFLADSETGDFQPRMADIERDTANPKRYKVTWLSQPM